MVTIIEPERVTPEEIKELRKLSANDTLILLSKEQGSIKFTNDFFNILKDIKANIETKYCSNSMELAFLCGLMSDKKTGMVDIKNSVKIADIDKIRALFSIYTGNSAAKTKRTRTSTQANTNTTIPTKEVNTKEKEPGTETFCTKEPIEKPKRQRTVKTKDTTSKGSPLKAFLSTLKDDSFDPSEYTEIVYKSLKESIIKKKKVSECIIQNAPSEAVAKELCNRIGPKAKELGNAYTEEIKLNKLTK